MDLLPCPFCGAPAEYGKYELTPSFWLETVQCTKCQCRTQGQVTKEQAAAIWNRRTQVTVNE